MLTSSSLNVKPVEALEERVRREKARRHLVDFECYVAPYYRPARHHRMVGEYLEKVELYVKTRGKEGIGRLLILEPPRHGKSEQMSRHFPAWFLGKQPDCRIILTSYNADLASKFSRSARDVVLSDKYKAIFGDLASIESPVTLSQDSRSVTSWDLAAPHRGGMSSAGVGGGITGMGANLFLVDDPFKNREEAESEAQRERVWEWWTSTAYTRLEDFAAVVASLTRWHGDDWAGRVIKAMAMDPKADQWTVISFPAIWEGKEKIEEKQNIAKSGTQHVASLQNGFEEYRRLKMLEGVWEEGEDLLKREVGEALWPEKYNEEDLERIRVNVGEYDWEALYQQRPFSRVGNLFQRVWFPIVEAPPKLEEIRARIWSWDKAGSQLGKGDYACGVLLSLTRDDIVFVENVIRKQCTPRERDEMMISALKADKATGRPIHGVWHQQDPGSAGLDSAEATNRMLVKEGFVGRFDTVTGDKEVRAGPWSSALQGNQARLVRGGWNNAFIEEHVAFPKGRYDDQVDAASWGFSKIMGGAVGVLFR